MQSNEMSFQFVGNNAAIDFVNTVVVHRGVEVDLLHAPEALRNWSAEAGLELEPGNVSAKELAEAKALREGFQSLFQAVINNDVVPREALTTLNAYLGAYQPRKALNLDGQRFEITLPRAGFSVQQLLGKLADDAAVLLASVQAERLRTCGNPDCVLLFVDVSRSGKRRWCSMEVCGNRAKVASHYKRNQAGP